MDNTTFLDYKHELSNFDNMLLYYPERLFSFNCGTVLVPQSIQDVGYTVWDAEVLLAHYMDKMATKIKGRSCIELGAGCALAAIVCSRYDGLCFAQELEQVSVHTMNCIVKNDANICVISSRWGDECITNCIAANKGSKFDFVLMADVLYHANDFNDLVNTINNLCAPSSTLLISFEVRRRDLSDFFVLIKNTFVQKSLQHYNITSSETSKITELNIYEFEMMIP